MLRRIQSLHSQLRPGYITKSTAIISNMSTFTLPDSENVEVTLVEDLSKEQLLEFPAFKNWLSTLRKNLSLQSTSPTHEFHSSPYTLRSIKIQSIDRFGGNRLGFVKFIADIQNANGEKLPGSIFLRGASVAMLILLIPEDAPEEKYVLLTVQPRVAAGSLRLVELPAGMVDGGTFAGSAAKEIEEELGLTIPETELINLTELAIPPALPPSSSSGDPHSQHETLPRAVFPSPGGCDEYTPIFMHEKRVPRSTLDEWAGKLTGLRDQGEKITLKVVRLEDLWKEGARDAKALSAWALWEGCKRKGLVW
ncbi:hypothetical protein F5884DRAFT_777629 [Xylogone sp. PMI_703]|nr:hypothetical protein F5884DRAFT_777629 [Xylogone sp. PMI_703]